MELVGWIYLIVACVVFSKVGWYMHDNSLRHNYIHTLIALGIAVFWLPCGIFITFKFIQKKRMRLSKKEINQVIKHCASMNDSEIEQEPKLEPELEYVPKPPDLEQKTYHNNMKEQILEAIDKENDSVVILKRNDTGVILGGINKGGETFIRIPSGDEEHIANGIFYEDFWGMPFGVANNLSKTLNSKTKKSTVSDHDFPEGTIWDCEFVDSIKDYIEMEEDRREIAEEERKGEEI